MLDDIPPLAAASAPSLGLVETVRVPPNGAPPEPCKSHHRRCTHRPQGGYVLVTHNTTDFRGLYRREELHVGLVAFNTAPGLMSLDLQHRLFHLALSELGGEEAWNEVLEITWMSRVPSPSNGSTSPTDGPPRSFPAIGLPEAAARKRKSPPREEVRRA
ncbi:hypothetical protein NKH63_30900 [Mesorhizobium sp. M0960]|uniref:hypothetical protein n=1 Tax=Mesorhizobium sp. M0960 TaxID=2957035 RepID=UPI003334EAA9